MFPILKPGDQVLLARGAYRRQPPRKGDIVVAEHPWLVEKKIVKRVSAVYPDGKVDLQGENPFETTDFRLVPAGKIVGKVTSVFFTK
jgi:signal peptidase I